MASGTYLTLGADIARIRGERDRERAFIEEALEHVQRSRQLNFVAFDLSEATFGAWLAGEDELAAKYAAELEADRRSRRRPRLRFFAQCARGRFEAQPAEADMLKWIACGNLIAAGEAPDAAEARRRALAALDAARAFRAPFTLLFACLAAAEFSPAKRHALPRGSAQARRARSKRPACAMPSRPSRPTKRISGCSRPFIRRMRRPRATDRPPVEVELLAGTVRVGGIERPLPDRELALIFAVARRREHIGREQLQELLWPELEPAAARNALNVCAHRLRAHLGDDTAVPARRRASGSARTSASISPTSSGSPRRSASAARPTTRAPRRCARRTNAWRKSGRGESSPGNGSRRSSGASASCAARWCSASRATLSSGGVTRRCSRSPRKLTAYDPCDEAARELAIRALLAMGDRAGALRHYRQYREILLDELDCEPSPAIDALVGVEKNRAAERTERSVKLGRPAAAP